MAARMMLAKFAKPSFPLHLLRGSLSAVSPRLNSQFQSNFPVDLQQIPLRADESSGSSYGLSPHLQQFRSADLNRVEFRKNFFPKKDEDDSDDGDFKDISDLDDSMSDDYLTEDFDDDEDEDLDDDEDEKVKGKNARRRK